LLPSFTKLFKCKLLSPYNNYALKLMNKTPKIKFNESKKKMRELVVW
jgi:hypothetical protein